MSNDHNVEKMVGIYKKLFLVICTITAIGIIVAFKKLPVTVAVLFALFIMAIKSKIVIDSFKFLITPRKLILLVFILTAVFFLALLILPALNHQGHIVGTVDTSKQLQMEEKPVEEHHGH